MGLFEGGPKNYFSAQIIRGRGGGSGVWDGLEPNFSGYDQKFWGNI